MGTSTTAIGNKGLVKVKYNVAFKGKLISNYFIPTLYTSSQPSTTILWVIIQTPIPLTAIHSPPGSS